jgi:large subunit ribosomal protein L9
MLKDVEKVGKAGDVVNVSPGYGRNYLIPRSQALLATDTNVAHFESRRRQYAVVAEREQRSAANQVAELEKVSSLTAQVRVGEGDRLFGSVTTQNVANLLKEKGHEIDRRMIMLKEPIRELGVYNIEIRLHPEVTATVKLWVVKE